MRREGRETGNDRHAQERPYIHKDIRREDKKARWEGVNQARQSEYGPITTRNKRMSPEYRRGVNNGATSKES